MMSSEIEMPIDEETGKHVNIGMPRTAERARPIVEAVNECDGIRHQATWTCPEWHYQTRIGCVGLAVYQKALELYSATVGESMEGLADLMKEKLKAFPDDPKVAAAVLETLISTFEKSHLAPNNKGAAIAEHCRAVIHDALFPDTLPDNYKLQVKRGLKKVL